MRKMRGGWYLSSWYEPVYRQNFWLVVNATNEQICAWVKKELKVDLPKDDAMAHGCTIPFYPYKDGFNGCAIWIPKWEPTPMMISTVAHEAVHATDFTLGDMSSVARGVSCDKNEAYAYYVGYITNKILEELASNHGVAYGECQKKNDHKRCPI